MLKNIIGEEMRTYSNVKRKTPVYTITDLRDLVRSSADRFGNKPEYIYHENGETKTVTYIEQYNNMIFFGTALSTKNLLGKSIAVIGDNHPFWMTAFNSTVNGGGVIVPLDKELDVDSIIDFVNRAGCAAIVYGPSFNGKISSRIKEMPCLEYCIPINPDSSEKTSERLIPFSILLDKGKMALESGNNSYNSINIEMEKRCSMLFTSGTTGTSKGVMLTQRNFTAAIMSSVKSTECDEYSTYVSVLPIHHTYELTCANLAATELGGTIYICDGLRYATRTFKEYKPNTLVLVPLFLETIHKKIWEEIRNKNIEKKVKIAMSLSNRMLKMGVDIRQRLFKDILSVFGGNLKLIVIGGAKMDPQIVEDFYIWGINVCQGYGITECAPLIAVNRPDKIKFDSVGQPVEDCEVRINKYIGSENGEGDIQVKGNNVMVGYFNDAELTKEAFTEDGWFITGDIGTMDDKGYITITGRKKDVIIASNGNNVYPEELEERLSKIAEIKEVVVIGRNTNDDNSTSIVAIIYPNYDVIGSGASKDEINLLFKKKIAEINRKIPAYKHINRFEIRTEPFERTLSKKIKRFLIK